MPNNEKSPEDLPETTRSKSKDVSPVRTYGLGTEPAPFLVFRTVICHMEGTCHMAAEDHRAGEAGVSASSKP